MASLSDKLKALGVKIGARDLPPPRPRRPESFTRLTTSPGSIFALRAVKFLTSETRIVTGSTRSPPIRSPSYFSIIRWATEGEN